MVPKVLPVQVGTRAEHDRHPHQLHGRNDGTERHRSLQVHEEARRRLRLCPQVGWEKMSWLHP